MNGHFALLLDNETTLLAGAAGGEIFADVVEEALGLTPSIKKHLAQLEYEDITVKVGATMSDALFDWIAAAWAAGDHPKDGVVLALDDRSWSLRRLLAGSRPRCSPAPLAVGR